jgi:hypothetical protein
MHNNHYHPLSHKPTLQPIQNLQKTNTITPGINQHSTNSESTKTITITSAINQHYNQFRINNNHSHSLSHKSTPTNSEYETTTNITSGINQHAAKLSPQLPASISTTTSDSKSNTAITSATSHLHSNFFIINDNRHHHLSQQPPLERQNHLRINNTHGHHVSQQPQNFHNKHHQDGNLTSDTSQHSETLEPTTQQRPPSP